MKITKTRGAAGQVSFTALTEDGELTFVGSSYAELGPIVMVTPSGMQTFVTDPSRFGGTFNEAWVRSFVGAA